MTAIPPPGDPREEFIARWMREHQQHIEEMACAWAVRTGALDPREAKIVEYRDGNVWTITIEHRDARLCNHPCATCEAVS